MDDSTATATALALTGLRVVQLGTATATSYATKVLAALGADVLVLPTDSDISNENGPTHTALTRYLDASKFVAKSLTSLPAPERLIEICSRADVVIEQFGPRGLERIGVLPELLRAHAPQLAIVRVSPRGQDEPREDYAWSSLTLQAGAGWVNRHDSRADGVPFKVGGIYSELAVGSFIAAATLTASRAAKRRGFGEDIDVSMTACLHSMLQRTRMRMDFFRELGLDISGIGNQSPAVHRCQDGWVGINYITGQHWSDLCDLVGMPEYADKQIAVAEDDQLRLTFDAQLAVWCADKSSASVVELAQAFRIPAAPVSDGKSIRDVSQWQERRFFVAQGGSESELIEPGPPWRPSVMPLRNDPPVVVSEDPSEFTWPDRVDANPTVGQPDALPLGGVRIVDLGAFYAAPYGTQYLGALGADVIKIEGIKRPDGFRFVGTSPALGPDWAEMSMMFQSTNFNKRSVSIDLTKSVGRELLLDLVADADLVIENFSARVLDNFGLGYDALRERNPKIIVLRLPGYGLIGPWREFVGFGPGFEQTGGLAHATGFPDQPPATPGGYLDPVVGINCVVSALAALAYRENTGQGQLVEVVQAEVAACMAADQILAYSSTGTVPGRLGNRVPEFAPQGVYPCQSVTGWVALTIKTDGDWRRLRDAMGSSALVNRPELDHVAGRLAAHDEIDELIAEWTMDQPGASLVAALQDLGIASAEVLAPSTYLEDAHLTRIGYYTPVEHPITGVRPYPGLPFRASFVPHHRSRSPLLGEHTHDVLTDILGLSAVQLDSLEGAGLIGPRPAIARGVTARTTGSD